MVLILSGIVFLAFIFGMGISIFLGKYMNKIQAKDQNETDLEKEEDEIIAIERFPLLSIFTSIDEKLCTKKEIKMKPLHKRQGQVDQFTPQFYPLAEGSLEWWQEWKSNNSAPVLKMEQEKSYPNEIK